MIEDGIYDELMWSLHDLADEAETHPDSIGRAEIIRRIREIAGPDYREERS